MSDSRRKSRIDVLAALPEQCRRLYRPVEPEEMCLAQPPEGCEPFCTATLLLTDKLLWLCREVFKFGATEAEIPVRLFYRAIEL